MLIAAVVLSGITAFGQTTYNSVGGLNYGPGTTNYAIIGQPPLIVGQTPSQLPGGQLRPVVTFLSATSDATASATTGAGNVQFYRATNFVTFVTNSTAATNVILINGTTGIGSSKRFGGRYGSCHSTRQSTAGHV